MRYKLPSGKSVTTTAKRRYLVVGQYEGSARPAVETTADDHAAAVGHRDRYRREFPFTTWLVIDQATGYTLD